MDDSRGVIQNQPVLQRRVDLDPRRIDRQLRNDGIDLDASVHDSLRESIGNGGLRVED